MRSIQVAAWSLFISIRRMKRGQDEGESNEPVVVFTEYGLLVFVCTVWSKHKRNWPYVLIFVGSSAPLSLGEAQLEFLLHLLVEVFRKWNRRDRITSYKKGLA